MNYLKNLVRTISLNKKQCTAKLSLRIIPPSHIFLPKMSPFFNVPLLPWFDVDSFPLNLCGKPYPVSVPPPLFCWTEQLSVLHFGKGESKKWMPVGTSKGTTRENWVVTEYCSRKHRNNLFWLVHDKKNKNF